MTTRYENATVGTRKALRLGLLAAMLLVGSAGCDDKECSRTSDCPAGHYCSRSGQCVPFEDVTRADADADADADAPSDRPAETPADGADGPADGAEDDAPGADGDSDVAEDDGGPGPCASDEDCDDGSPCTDDRCEAGECTHAHHPDGEPCPDDEWCDGVEECFDGLCRNTVTPCPEPPDPCIYAACDEATHTCRDAPVVDGMMCGAETACGAIDVCIDGACTRRLEGACDDGNPCTIDRCVTDAPGAPPHCERDHAADGTSCTTADPCGGGGARVCVAGNCIAASDAPCGDGSLCTVTACWFDGSCTTVSPTPSIPPLACGSGVTASTFTGANDVSSYGTCASGLTGGEVVYAVDLPAWTVRLTATLSDVVSNGTPTVLVLGDACDPASCVASGASSVAATVTGGRRYYVVVDGAANARAAFSLAVDCS
ncbi:MAG: hypothetical protein GYA57_11975 [Myxococcales bacterium]|nr:hypothetical protein [Myxococcales bacterium]